MNRMIIHHKRGIVYLLIASGVPLVAAHAASADAAQAADNDTSTPLLLRT